MQHMVAELAYPVVLSDRALRELATVHRAAQAHRRASGGEASAAQLAAACNLSREHVLQLLAVDRLPGPIANALSDVALAQWLTPERQRNGTARAIPARSVAHARR
jgi:RNA polymerase primary sigma factor